MLGTINKAEREVTVVGAGISGLLAADALERKGYRVTLLEERARAGGLIQTRQTAYGIAETAAHSLLATPGVVRFCEGLGVELAEIRRDSRARFIVRGGRARKFPLSIGETLDAARHAAFTRAVNHLDEQDLDAWGRRHLGEGAAEYLLSPFVQGIYGARPADLGVVAAFPELSLAPGSTLLGTLLGKALKRQRGKDGEPKQSRRMVAPLRGMGDVTERLQQRLLESLGERFRRGEAAREIPDTPNVILATPAYVTARPLSERAPRLSAALGEVRYTPVVSVTAFVPVSAFTRPVKGVGVLSPPREGRKALGILFNSSAFEGRVLDESRYASFTVLFGGTAQPHWVEATDEEIGRAVSEELAQLLGIRGEPVELVINRWPRAIPQYSTALPHVWRAARETWCAAPGRMLFGNYTGQVSLRGMIETADEMG